MPKKVWKIKPQPDEFTVKSLVESLNISETLARLLVLRDIKNYQQAKAFFRPSLDSLPDPFLMNGMECATTRVITAITENELICIYGDYDVDGTCATALLYMFLKELGAQVDFYIPKRLTEGYGISKIGIEHVKERGTSLLISVDCGITAVEETQLANELGMSVIICDHHQPKEELPQAYAVLDPLKPNCNYPFKYLSGAGIAFKLAQGVAERIGKRELPLKYLDLVALAASADIVSLTDENRVLVKEGLNQINHSPRPGISALIKNSHLEPGDLTSGQIVFTIAPRINAVGRLGDAERAVKLLITNNIDEAFTLAAVLESENYERRKIDEDTFFQALDLVEGSLDLDKNLAIILHEESWHPGVIGIVASRLVEKYYRPTIMLTTVDGVAKGSARSTGNFNIYEALKKCEDLLLHFGGHQSAAGLAVEVDKIDDFRSKFNQIVKETLGEDEFLPEVHIDAKLKFSDLTPKFFKIIDQFAPFGPGNMRPVFLAEDLHVEGKPRFVGNNHLIINLKQNGSDRVLDCIGFNMGEMCEALTKNQASIEAVFSIDKYTKDGKTFPQLKLKDIHINDKNQESN
ncbi:MAG: single-stranded-DNA-specific exonuclease RecJ [Ignavibacteria bacterium RIFOXYB2_FULL_35_12]|nr:MAG: single-stranded-DNA-specific exonuclease RecJ [Ignavibacteria bacterium GWC2_35_8]OGU60772.1 MAG: single-stranded-DNA-specific exonuclease RecJ [Ignavibacteria bacterium GWF2_35_20]OGU78264.1 MAG: single-stranded-DNA-specific exonuclease RecJ [Ignavibacteria bacterium RIFOXYA2_FULL_35_9]OGU84189.1 MAG: single-stranded-DNA-specific exonuclease RecJ [Ignavibacteria bacterium RIFOXYA12_FULL_35_25]OGU90051.1 MAG: single-stranded-DNA-specific exonuclease RecJ [Ignavibacteria bacterium RIFOXY